MALTKCVECASEISDKAECCPHCGNPLPQQAKVHVQPPKELDAIQPKKQTFLSATKDSIKNNTAESSKCDHRVNKKLLAIILIITVFLISIVISGIKDDKNAKEAFTIENKEYLNNAKKILANNTNIADSDYVSAKELLGKVDPQSKEYPEAQSLQQSISGKIDAINKKQEENKKKQELLEKKQRLNIRLYGLNAIGKRLAIKHPDWSSDDCDTISKGKISLGMTTDQVQAAWGRPYRINRTHGSYGTHEQWVMHELGNTYVYFENDICTTIQN